MEQCVALVDYETLAPGEISFRKGDVITVTAKGSASGFWEGYVVPRPTSSGPPAREKGGKREKRSERHGGKRGPSTQDSETDAAVSGSDGAQATKKQGVFANCFVSSNLRNMTSSFFLNKAVCLYAFTASSPDKAGDEEDASQGEDGGRREGVAEREMSFCRGDVLTVVRPSSSPGWWLGINESARQRMRLGLRREGQEPTISASHHRSRSSAQQRRPSSLSTLTLAAQGDLSRVPAAQRLPLSSNRAVGRRGSSNGSSMTTAAASDAGDVPLLSAAQAAQVDAACGSLERPLLFPSNFVSCDIVQAVFTFQGRQPHELSCHVGDVILVHRRWNDGWWEGSLRGRRGIFPSNYTAPNICTTRPAFFCAKCKTIYDDTKTANMALFLNKSESLRVPRDGDGRAGEVGSFASNRAHSSRGGEEGDSASSDREVNLWRECATCAQNARITDNMLRALAAFDAGIISSPDLFAFVRTTKDSGDGDHHDETGAEDEMSSDAARDDRRAAKTGALSAGREAHHDPALLNTKDVADISAGRVKF